METKTNGKEQMALNFDNIGDPTSRQTVRQTTSTHCRRTRARSRQLQAAEIGVRSRHGLAENCPPSATTKSSRVRDMYLCMYVYNMIIYGQKTMDNVVSVHGQSKCQLLALSQTVYVQRVERFF